MDIMHEFGCNFTNTFTVLSGELNDEDRTLQSLVEQACPVDIHL